MSVTSKSLAAIGIALWIISVFLPWVYWEGITLGFWSGRPAALFLFLSGLTLIISGGVKGKVSIRGAIIALAFAVVSGMLFVVALNPGRLDDPVTPAIGYILQVIALVLFLIAGISALLPAFRERA